MVSHPDFEYPYGAFIPALYALSATRHMHDRGTTRAGLAAVAVASRDWALGHPTALMRDAGPLTVAEAEPPMLDLQPLADIEPCPTPP